MIPETGLDVAAASPEPCLPFSVCKTSFTVFFRKIVRMIEVLLVVVNFLKICYYSYFIYIYFFGCAACGILVPQPRVKPMSPVLEALGSQGSPGVNLRGEALVVLGDRYEGGCT